MTVLLRHVYELRFIMKFLLLASLLITFVLSEKAFAVDVTDSFFSRGEVCSFVGASAVENKDGTYDVIMGLNDCNLASRFWRLSVVGATSVAIIDGRETPALFKGNINTQSNLHKKGAFWLSEMDKGAEVGFLTAKSHVTMTVSKSLLNGLINSNLRFGSLVTTS